MLSTEYATSKYVNTEHLSKLKLTYKSDFWNTQEALVHGQVYYGYQGVLLPWELMQETCRSRTMLEVTDFTSNLSTLCYAKICLEEMNLGLAFTTFSIQPLAHVFNKLNSNLINTLNIMQRFTYQMNL